MSIVSLGGHRMQRRRPVFRRMALVAWALVYSATGVAMAQASAPRSPTPVVVLSLAGTGAAVGGIFAGVFVGGTLEYVGARAIGKAGNDRLSPFGRYAPGRPDPPRARILAEVIGVAVIEPLVVAATVHTVNRRQGRFDRTWLVSQGIALATIGAVALSKDQGEGVAFIAILAQPVAAAFVESRTSRR